MVYTKHELEILTEALLNHVMVLKRRVYADSQELITDKKVLKDYRKALCLLNEYERMMREMDGDTE